MDLSPNPPHSSPKRSLLCQLFTLLTSHSADLCRFNHPRLLIPAYPTFVTFASTNPWTARNSVCFGKFDKTTTERPPSAWNWASPTILAEQLVGLEEACLIHPHKSHLNRSWEMDWSTGQNTRFLRATSSSRTTTITLSQLPDSAHEKPADNSLSGVPQRRDIYPDLPATRSWRLVKARLEEWLDKRPKRAAGRAYKL